MCRQSLLQRGSTLLQPHPPPSLAVLLGTKKMKGKVEALAKEMENKQNKLFGS